ncbi:MAG: hypothetical protein ACOCYT_00225 [Chloroflexota bacterium]
MSFIPMPGTDPLPEPRLTVHKVRYTAPEGMQRAASLLLTGDKLVVVMTGDAAALAHFPVIRGTPWLRVSPPDLVDEHKQKEGQLYILSLAEAVQYMEHRVIDLSTLEAVSVAQRASDPASDEPVPVLTLEAAGEVHRFGLRLVSPVRADELVTALGGAD